MDEGVTASQPTRLLELDYTELEEEDDYQAEDRMENGVFIPERELQADPHWGPCTTTTFVSTSNLRDDVTTTFAKMLPHKSFRGGLRC